MRVLQYSPPMFRYTLAVSADWIAVNVGWIEKEKEYMDIIGKRMAEYEQQLMILRGGLNDGTG